MCVGGSKEKDEEESGSLSMENGSFRFLSPVDGLLGGREIDRFLKILFS